MPHSKPSATSRASSLKRLSWSIVVSWITVPSRTTRTWAPRRTTPFVTMQPAIVPSRETLNSARTSASPEDLLGRDRRQHPDERLLDVLGQLVDDAVGADVDALALGELPRLGARPHVEADDERVRRRREVDVVLRDAADARVDHVDAHLGMLDLAELAEQRLDRALHVALEHDVEVLDGAGLHLLEERLERDAAAFDRCASCSRRSRSARFSARSFAWRSCSTTRPSSPAGGGRSKPRISTGSPGLGLLHLLAAVVVERADLAGGVARDDRVADAQRAALDEHRRDGAAPDVESRLDDRTGRLGLRVRAKVELGVRDEQHLLEQLLEARLLLRGDLGELRRRRPSPRAEALRLRARS